jgi:hypothetical protein
MVGCKRSPIPKGQVRGNHYRDPDRSPSSQQLRDDIRIRQTWWFLLAALALMVSPLVWLLLENGCG